MRGRLLVFSDERFLRENRRYQGEHASFPRTQELGFILLACLLFPTFVIGNPSSEDVKRKGVKREKTGEMIREASGGRRRPVPPLSKGGGNFLLIEEMRGKRTRQTKKSGVRIGESYIPPFEDLSSPLRMDPR